MTEIFAHRGASAHYFENTMPAFIAALESGADGIEFDVRLSKDEEVVIVHDARVDRTTNGKGFVSDFTVAQLKELQVRGSAKSSHLGKAEILCLWEIFQWLQHNSLLINIELKVDIYPQEVLVAKVLAEIEINNLSERVIISSFCHETLVTINKRAPFIRTSLIYSERMFRPWIYAHICGSGGLHPKMTVVSLSMIQNSQSKGIAVRPYGIKNIAALTWALKAQCAGIMVDDPKKAVMVRSDLCL